MQSLQSIASVTILVSTECASLQPSARKMDRAHKQPSRLAYPTDHADRETELRATKHIQYA